MTGQCLPIAHAAQAEHNIVHPTGSVGHADFDYGAPKAQKADTHAVVVGHRIDVDRLPLLGLAIRLVLHRAGGGGRAGGERRREGGSQRNHAQRIYAARMGSPTNRPCSFRHDISSFGCASGSRVLQVWARARWLKQSR